MKVVLYRKHEHAMNIYPLLGVSELPHRIPSCGSWTIGGGPEVGPKCIEDPLPEVVTFRTCFKDAFRVNHNIL